MKQRIGEIDFLRCVLILLMVTFHIVYAGDTYPLAKRVVYTFHMPAFLVVSGFLCNTSKDRRQFFRSMLWIFIPYLETSAKLSLPLINSLITTLNLKIKPI